MNTTGKTVLITGGSAGIGFEIAKSFSEKGNKVIIVGRNKSKLEAAAARLRDADFFVADVSVDKDADDLVSYVTKKYPSLDVLVNNAAATTVYTLGEGGALANAQREIQTNYLSVIGLIEKLMPVLAKQREAAIVNVTAILALAPAIPMPTHSASKAALHSFTQVLRLSLKMKGSPIQVFELMPPLTNTEFSKAIGGAKGIAAEVVAQGLIDGLENDVPEIRVGGVADFYNAFFAGSENAVVALNQPRG